jgi:hypothetical protein
VAVHRWFVAGSLLYRRARHPIAPRPPRIRFPRASTPRSTSGVPVTTMSARRLPHALQIIGARTRRDDQGHLPGIAIFRDKTWPIARFGRHGRDVDVARGKASTGESRSGRRAGAAQVPGDNLRGSSSRRSNARPSRPGQARPDGGNRGTRRSAARGLRRRRPGSLDRLEIGRDYVT